MAKLGVRTIDELVGRTDLLRVKEHPKSRHAATLNLSGILRQAYAGSGREGSLTRRRSI